VVRGGEKIVASGPARKAREDPETGAYTPVGEDFREDPQRRGWAAQQIFSPPLGRRVVVGFVLLLLLAFDLSRPAPRQVSARLLLGAVHLYQATLSPLMPYMGVRCRFRPSCSHYAAGALAKYGAFGGTWRAAWRVLRCGPWTPAGTYDPP
jgi:uncharacterized protein